MSDELQSLLSVARNRQMSDSEREAQRQSFAYGNAKLSNDDITRETVRLAAAELTPSDEDFAAFSDPPPQEWYDEQWE